MAESIKRIPLIEIPDYKTTFYVISSLKEGWTDSFINRVGLNNLLMGLPRLLQAPVGAKIQQYPSLRSEDEYHKKEFGFDPNTYMHVDGFHNHNKNINLADLARKTLERYMHLTEREKEHTIIFTDSRDYYACSSNLLNK